jgi:hypothetical protein
MEEKKKKGRGKRGEIGFVLSQMPRYPIHASVQKLFWCELLEARDALHQGDEHPAQRIFLTEATCHSPIFRQYVV